jgi:hypothetical protein
VKSKILKAVALAATAFMILSAEGCPPEDPGKAGPGKKVTIWQDGETTLGVQNSRKTMKATNPKSSCKWTLMYDIPRTKKVAVVATGGAKTARKGVKMAGPGTIKYKDPKSGKMVSIKTHPTTFYSEDCGPWQSK